ncbi:hypothetical protein [Micromonospora sp. NPDC005652]|uniref:hypothetical protein n=1 Tax=Micromonospora sp. NPDC005652 TaxID=3157046 RepID=UPI0033E6FA5F
METIALANTPALAGATLVVRSRLTLATIADLRASDNDPETSRARRRALRGRPTGRGSRSDARRAWVRESVEAFL